MIHVYEKHLLPHPRFKVLTESCISVQYSARPGGIILFLKDNASKGCTMGPKPFKSLIYKNSTNIFSNFLVLYLHFIYNWPVSKISHETMRIRIWLQNNVGPNVGILLARLMPLKGRNCKYCKLLEHFQWLPLDSF